MFIRKVKFGQGLKLSLKTILDIISFLIGTLTYLERPLAKNVELKGLEPRTSCCGC